MSTPKHCPGFANFKHLKSFFCKCPQCDEEIEIFSDEFDREHKCKKCGVIIEFDTCSPYGEAGVQ
jgi:ribosomal protein S27E